MAGGSLTFLSCPHSQLSNLTEIHDQISGMARCPYSPQHNSTALLTAGGELYAATAMDFPGRDPAIYRSLGILPPLRTAQYNSKWLNGESYPPTRLPISLVCDALFRGAQKQAITVFKIKRFPPFLKESKCNLFCSLMQKGIRGLISNQEEKRSSQHCRTWYHRANADISVIKLKLLSHIIV